MVKVRVLVRFGVLVRGKVQCQGQGRRNRGVRNSVRLTSRSESDLRIWVMKRVRMNIKIR